MEHAIAHQTDNSRYVLTVDGVEAGSCHYVDADTTREFNHTVIKDAFRGQGLSAPLIKAAPVSYTHLTLPTIYSV